VCRDESSTDGGGIYAELPPHAYGPQTNLELFEGLLARRSSLSLSI